MLELLNEAISPANLIYTILLGLAILYALSVLVGFAGMDAIDFDIDADIDVDVDTDVDVNGAGIWFNILSFFNMGKIPFMIIYSVTTLFMWAIGMVVNHYLGNGNILFTLMTIIPVLLIALMITKVITTPLIPAFKDMHEGSDETDYIGLKANLLLPISGSKKSQAEVYIDGDIHRITVSLRKEDKIKINKGTEVYITGVSGDKSFYWIAKDDLI